MESFYLEKSIWTELDFESMGWHDATIYGFTFEKGQHSWTSDLVLDIDYIFRWIDYHSPENTFKFLVSPCTLIFKEAFKLNMNLETLDHSLEGLEISYITLLETSEHGNNSFRYNWAIKLQNGEILFESSGFVQIVRKPPMLSDSQTLSLEQRGGISFERNAF